MGPIEHEELCTRGLCSQDCMKEDHRSFLCQLINDLSPLGGVPILPVKFPTLDVAVKAIEVRLGGKVRANLWRICHVILEEEVLAFTSAVTEVTQHKWKMLEAARQLEEVLLKHVPRLMEEDRKQREMEMASGK